MRSMAILLTLAAGLLASRALAQQPQPDPAPIVEAMEAAPEQGGGGKKKEEAAVVLLLLLLCSPAALVSLVTIRTAVSLGIAALFPGATERGREQMVARPWMAFLWGAFLALLVLALASLLQSAGDAAGLLVLLLLAAAVAAAAVGSTCICEWLGGRLFELMPRREPSRAGKLVLGSIVLPLLAITPPGIPVFLCVLLPLSLGTCRLAMARPR